MLEKWNHAVLYGNTYDFTIWFFKRYSVAWVSSSHYAIDNNLTVEIDGEFD
jgi:hypothetical protein